MTLRPIRKFTIMTAIVCLCGLSYAQPSPDREKTPAKENKPYKILTSGKQVTIRSTKQIKAVMVWTSTGHRIIEEKAINSTTFSFNVNVNDKVYFIMIQYEGTKPYTEKIGV